MVHQFQSLLTFLYMWDEFKCYSGTGSIIDSELVILFLVHIKAVSEGTARQYFSEKYFFHN